MTTFEQPIPEGGPLWSSVTRRVISPSLRYCRDPSPGAIAYPVTAPLSSNSPLREFQPAIKPVWGPEVQALKQKVKQLEESEQQLVETFASKEQLSNEEVDFLEKKYTEQLEVLREGDLQQKDKLHKKFYRLRRKLAEQRQQQRDQAVEERVRALLREREQALKERLEQCYNALCGEFEQELQPLEDELRRLQAAAASPTQAALVEGMAARERFGLELTNIASRGGGSPKGVRVLRASGVALAAGIRTGDVITNATRAVELTSRELLAHLTPTVRPGDQMMLTLRRGQTEAQVILTVGKAPPPQQQQQLPGSASKKLASSTMSNVRSAMS